MAVEKSITEVGQELTELVEHLVDTVRSLQNQRPLSESGPDNELSILGKVGSTGRGKDVGGNRARDCFQQEQHEYV